MWDADDPLPDAIAIGDVMQALESGEGDDVMARFGNGALLVPATGLRRPRPLARTLDPASPGLIESAHVVVLPLMKRSERNPYSYVAVGRAMSNDVVIMDTSVSKVHAMLHFDDGVASVIDAGSKNGTFVVDRRVALRGEGDPMLLGEIALLRFGSVVTTYVAYDALREKLLALTR